MPVASMLSVSCTERARACGVAEAGLVRGDRIGVDGSTMEANAALRTIVAREGGADRSSANRTR